MEGTSHLILYNYEIRDNKRALDVANATEHSSSVHPRSYRYSTTKEKNEDLQDDTSEKHFVCARTREWNCILSCDDLEEISHDGRMVWATETPSIAQLPHGLDWEFKTRGDSYKKLAYGYVCVLFVDLH
jgi:hypothetical protein